MSDSTEFPTPPWYASAACWCMVIGAAHVAATPLFYRESLRALLSGPLIGALDAHPSDPAVRGAAFWYATTGTLLGVLGLRARADERQARPPCPVFAGGLAGLGLIGCVASPRSGFWAVLAAAGLEAARLRRTRSTAGRRDALPVGGAVVKRRSGRPAGEVTGKAAAALLVGGGVAHLVITLLEVGPLYGQRWMSGDLRHNDDIAAMTQSQAAFWISVGSWAVPQALLGVVVWRMSDRRIPVPLSVPAVIIIYAAALGLFETKATVFGAVIAGLLAHSSHRLSSR